MAIKKKNKSKISLTSAVVALSVVVVGGLLLYKSGYLKMGKTPDINQIDPGFTEDLTASNLFTTNQFVKWYIYSPYKTQLVRLDPQGVSINESGTFYAYPNFWASPPWPNPELGDPGFTYLRSFNFATAGPKLNTALGYNSTTHLYTGTFKSVVFEYNATWKPCYASEIPLDKQKVAGDISVTLQNAVRFDFFRKNPTQVAPQLAVAKTDANGLALQTYTPASQAYKPNLSKVVSFPVTKTITIDPNYTPECMLPGTDVTHSYKVSLTKADLNKFAPLSTLVMLPAYDNTPFVLADGVSLGNPSGVADLHVNYVKVSVVR